MNKAREIATAIARQLQDNGYTAVLAGGCGRDQFLNLEPKDYDIATSATPEQVKAVFKDDLALAVEIATFRGDGQYGDGRRPDSVKLLNDCDPLVALREDAARRDLTINAMFLDPVSGELYDFFGGRADIESRTLRAVGDAAQRFNEDRLRMLRVVEGASGIQQLVISRSMGM